MEGKEKKRATKGGYGEYYGVVNLVQKLQQVKV